MLGVLSSFTTQRDFSFHVFFYTPTNHQQLLRVTAIKLNNLVAVKLLNFVTKEKNYSMRKNNAYQLR